MSGALLPWHRALGSFAFFLAFFVRLFHVARTCGDQFEDRDLRACPEADAGRLAALTSDPAADVDPAAVDFVQSPGRDGARHAAEREPGGKTGERPG